MTTLSEVQRRFVLAMLATGNAVHAAKLMGIAQEEARAMLDVREVCQTYRSARRRFLGHCGLLAAGVLLKQADDGRMAAIATKGDAGDLEGEA